MYRSIFSPLRGRSTQSVNLLQRFNTSKKIQSRGYVKSTRHKSEIPKSRELLPETNPSSNSRSFMTFAIPTVLIGFVGVAGYVRYNDERRAIPKAEGAKEATSVKGPVIGGPFNLINTEGKVVTEQDLRGNWVLLYFGYTSSPDVGPAELQKLAKTIKILESENVKLLPVFVTIDPQRDSPSHLKAYLGEFDPRIVGLTGPVNCIRQMAQEYRIFFKKVEEDGSDYLIESFHNMYLLNPNMEIMKCFGLEYGATQLAEAIVKEYKRSAT